MATQQQVQGIWNELRGKTRETWGQITQNEWDQVEGNVQKLVGLVQRKTGQSREQIEEKIRGFSKQASQLLDEASSTASRYAAQAMESAQATAEQLGETMRDQYHHAEEMFQHQFQKTGEMIQRRPVESLVVALGAGILFGVVVSMLTRSK